jgi:hypothetical protein
LFWVVGWVVAINEKYYKENYLIKASAELSQTLKFILALSASFVIPGKDTWNLYISFASQKKHSTGYRKISVTFSVFSMI